ncbi:MAG: protein kinase [Verrucomicrobiae bacterium]|nr:protein kinase [Verrucomicrobiae bacterium]
MSEFPQFPGCSCHDLISEGSCGVVYAGLWEEETDVAVKVFKPEAINREYVKHCLDMLRSSESHPGILHVHDHDLDGDPAYCVMDLCLDYGQEPPEPQTLESICGQVPPEVAWQLIGQLADAMAHMHSLGIVHCGLKTSNIFISGSKDNPRLRISDVGQGWLGGVGRLALNDHTFYASPEQLAQPEKLFETDVQTWDVYAFGAVAYRLLTGYFPRFEEELDALREQIEKEPHLPIVFDPNEYAAAAQNYPEIFWPDAPGSHVEAERRDILIRCLALNPANRYPNMRVVKDTLEKVASLQSAAVGPMPHADDDLDIEDDGASAFAKMPPPAAPAAAIQVSQEYEAPRSNPFLRVLPWLVAVLLAGAAGLFFKLYSDAKTDLAAAETALKTTQSAIEEFSGALANKTALEQKTATERAENQLEAVADRSEKMRAQRNLAKAQDTADFFFGEFIESGSEVADTPERRIAFERAEHFYQSILASAEGDPVLLDSVARATLNLALIQNGLGKTTEAEAGYNQAITSIAELIEQDPTGPTADDHRLRLAKARVSAAKLGLSRGDFEHSIIQLEQASEQYRPFAGRLASEPALRYSVAEVYVLNGRAMREVERVDDAMAQLGRAIELLTAQEESPSTSPKNSLLLSKSYFERGRCLLAASKFDAGAEDHVKAVDILLQLHDLDPESPSYRFNLGINYWALGEMLAPSGLWKEAGRAHSEAVKYLKSLMEQFPNTPEYKMALARDYAAVARMLRDQGAPEKAIDYQRGTVIFINEVVTKARATDLDRHELATNRGLYAELLASSGNLEDATNEARQAVTMLEEIRIKQKAGSYLQKKFQMSLASLYGTLGDVSDKSENKEEAITSFKKAVETWQQLTTAGHKDDEIIKGLEWSIERLTTLDPEAMKDNGSDSEPDGDEEAA